MLETRPHTAHSLIGAVLGSHRIVAEITSGGMGTVFRAEHVLLGRPAAVKLLRADLSTNHELVQRFLNEARAVTACKHPGIVEVYDFGYTAAGHAYIVMELLDGEPLGRRLARARLGERAAATIAHGIASALRAAHRVGVIHRDLKPDNVFLVRDPDDGSDRPKVLDFGIAKLAGPGGDHRTQTGTLIGTPLYMAPEQARAAGAIDARADLYSLGCILYHMLVGRPPFVAEGAGEIIALQMFGAVEPPSQHAEVSPGMDQLVMRLLEKEPARRFASAGEVAAGLAALGASPASEPGWVALPAGLEVPPTLPEVSAARPRTSRARIALPVLAGVLGTAVAAAVVRYGTQPTTAAPAVPASLAPVAASPPTSSPSDRAAPAALAPAPPASLDASIGPATATATVPAPRPPRARERPRRPPAIDRPRSRGPAAPAALPRSPDGSPIADDLEPSKAARP
jgi:eukaryotic-like serine/threonine-protein kinase